MHTHMKVWSLTEAHACGNAVLSVWWKTGAHEYSKERKWSKCLLFSLTNIMRVRACVWVEVHLGYTVYRVVMM